MNRILTIAGTEFRIARRNRWITVSAVLMMIFALVLTAAGSAPSGALAADRLSVVVASLTSLAVYVVPLIALLLSFDAIAGEVERGTLSLLLTYPVSRAEALAGKLLAHIAVLTLALLAVLGMATVLVAVSTALVGPVTFLGLLVANLAYLVIPSHRHALVLPAASLIAVVCLVGGQTVLERVFAFDTSLSIIVEFLGGIVFLVLLLSGRAR